MWLNPLPILKGDPMDIGARLKKLRIERKLTQGDIEKRTGLLRCYSSRVENGFTVPSIETLEKFAKAFEIPLYELFYNGPGRIVVLKAGESVRKAK
jgi:transcriptional regulator with XRE-family HTH domain